MKRLLYVIVVVMVLGLIGCGNQQTVVGEWGTIDAYRYYSNGNKETLHRSIGIRREFTDSGRYYVINSVYKY